MICVPTIHAMTTRMSLNHLNTCPPAAFCAALADICAKVARDVRKSTFDERGDWRPMLFIMTDGKPSDTQACEEAIPLVEAAQFAAIIACGAGPKSVPDQLKRLTDTVVSLDTMDSSGFASFFQWVSSAVTAGSATAGSTGAASRLELPPPPAEVQIVL